MWYIVIWGDIVILSVSECIVYRRMSTFISSICIPHDPHTMKRFHFLYSHHIIYIVCIILYKYLWRMMIIIVVFRWRWDVMSRLMFVWCSIGWIKLVLWLRKWMHAITGRRIPFLMMVVWMVMVVMVVIIVVAIVPFGMFLPSSYHHHGTQVIWGWMMVVGRGIGRSCKIVVGIKLEGEGVNEQCWFVVAY